MRSLAWLPLLLPLVALAPLAACGAETESAEDASSTGDPEPSAPRLGLNDVSVLIPLPASLEATGYLVPTSAGAQGELLPRAVYDEIPTFPVTPSQGLDYDRMRTVAIRFDGCQPLEEGCAPHIRLVMQPLANDGSARDSALHLFYRLDEAVLPELVTELRRLRTLAPEVADAPLDVHAALVAQGMEGAYGQALREVVLRFAGEANFTRMTFFLRAPPVNEVWFFGGFDRVAGELEVMTIVEVGQGNQQVIREDLAEGWAFTVNPAPALPQVDLLLLTSAGADAATPQQRADSFATYLRVDNPRLRKTDDLPCAGCHLSTYLTAAARTAYGIEDASFPDDVFTSEHDLTLRGGAETTPESLRAFGFFRRDAMIAKRVVHESADVVDDLEARFPAP